MWNNLPRPKKARQTSEGGLYRPPGDESTQGGLRPSLVLRSVPAWLRPLGPAWPRQLDSDRMSAHSVIDASLMLNDFTLHGARVFASRPVAIGSELFLQIDSPRKFTVKARVLACFDPVLNRRVFHANPQNYRVVLGFAPQSELDAECLAQFFSEVQLLLQDPLRELGKTA